MYNGNTKTSSVFTTKFLYGRKTYIGNSYTDKYGYLDYENNTPTREGYTFAGWKFSNGTGGLNSDGSEFFFGEIAADEDTTYDDDDIYIFNGDYTEDVTATAQWTKGSYQQNVYVRYQNEDGSWGDYSDKYWHISTDEAPNGYWEYFRWTIDNGDPFWFGLDDIKQDSRWDDTLYEFPDTFTDGSSLSYTVTGESKKYVDIKRKQYTMNFNKGLTNSTETMSDVEKSAGNSYEIPLPKWLGRSYVITLDNDGSKTTISGNLTFDQWKGYKNIPFSEIKKDDARYDWYSDGELLENIRNNMTFVANWNSEEITLPTPTKSGYIFDGWYEDKAFTKKVNGTTYEVEPDTTALDITLYAKWTKEAPKTAYLQTFSGKGISSTNYSTGSNINIGTEVTVTATLKTGYKFVNWTDGSGNKKSTSNVKVSATVKANTEQYTYSWKRWESSNTTLLANSTDKDYAFTMPAGNIMLKATGSNSTNGYSVVVNVRYQDVNGTWGKYESVINANYNYGSTVTWNRNADATYKAVNYSEKVTGNIVKNIDIERNKYTQTVMVRYENADGSFTDYNKEVSEDKFYGSTYNWNRNADTVYKAANIPDYTVTGVKENKVTIYRNTHTITVMID